MLESEDINKDSIRTYKIDINQRYDGYLPHNGGVMIL